MEEETNTQNSEEVEIIEEDSKVDEKIRKLKKELATCKLEKEEYLKGWQRAKADYINLERSLHDRQTHAASRAQDSVFKEILDLADSFEKAFSADVPDSQWASGIRQIYDKLKTFMKTGGIEMIETRGKKFDPMLHEAVEIEDTKNESDDDMITAELQKGYTINGRVLRPSRVKVAHYKGEK